MYILLDKMKGHNVYILVHKIKLNADRMGINLRRVTLFWVVAYPN